MEDNNQQSAPQSSFFSRYKWYILAIGGIILWNMFSSKSTSSDTVTVQYTDEEVIEPTQGVITHISEMSDEVFKITNEEIIPLKADSRIITTYLTGEIDTFSLAEAALIDTTITDRNDSHYRRGRMGSVMMWGMMGYMMGGRSMGSPLRRSAYASSSAYSKSSTVGRTQMNKTATRRTVRRPSSTSSRKTGYGSGKSTRSYGG